MSKLLLTCIRAAQGALQTLALCITITTAFMLHMYVQWDTVKGQTYYIGVHGWIDEPDGVYIHLLVDLVSDSDNDACYDAMLVPSFPWNVTQKISATDQISEGGCTGPLQRTGRWYYFTSDAPVQVSVDSCNSDTSESTTIEVYADTYNPCFMSLCETYSDTNYCSGKGQVAWMALAGIPYFIFATPTKSLSLGSMTVSLDFETFDNSQCVNAYQVPAGISSWSTRSYTTYSSTSFSSCTQQYSPALWYAIQGTGGTISASTCTSQTVFDTILSVFSSCNGTVESCVAYNDNGKYCGGTSLVTWTSYKGTEYFLQVAGMNGAKGMFEVTVSM
ncbi:hypothetical protein Pelo_4566 [Pelomyxa schiedti]|nr:hypothetical protein Pelo_4566 [Pelomyxa schiedti]